MSSVKDKVDEAIKTHKVLVIQKSGCPYCTMAKQVLDNEPDAKGDIFYWDISNDSQMSAIQDYLNKLTGGRSVPRVFINQKFIGGGSETKALQANGQLKKLLKETANDS